MELIVFFHDLQRCFEIEYISRTIVEEYFNGENGILIYLRDICSLGNILAYQSIRELNSSLLPGVIRMTEIYRSLEYFG